MQIVKPREIFNRLPKSDELIRVPMPHGYYERESLGLTLLEVFILIALAKSVKARTLLEIGTYRGYTSNALALNLPGCLVTTIDISPQVEWHNSGVQYVIGDSKLYTERPPVSVDLIFIDGDHSPAGFSSDMKLAERLRSRQGIIVWHDCGSPQFSHIQEFTEGCGAYTVQNTQLAVWDQF